MRAFLGLPYGLLVRGLLVPVQAGWRLDAWRCLGSGMCVNGRMVLPRSARATAASLALVAVASCGSLILFFIVGGPFGTINDVGNALLAVLCAALALVLQRRVRMAATTVALAGTVVAVLGTFLVMSDTTGYYLAGLVSALGFALIGLWLVAMSRSENLPAATSALIAGVAMAIGTVNVAGIIGGIDNQDAAPSWLLAAGVCWAGTYLLLPIWSIRFARSFVGPAGLTGPNEQGRT